MTGSFLIIVDTMFQTPENIPVPTPTAEELDSGRQFFDALKGLSFDDALSKIANGLVSFGFKLMIAILVFYVGRFIIKKIYKVTNNVMVSRHVDVSLTTFVLSLVKMVLYFILIITVIGIIGIETSSFLALFASAGVAIGMALSGTLQNFAGGVLILLLKPYKVGDYIEAQGYAGKVKAIQIFHTIINTVDNKAIIIPNGGLSTSSVNNYSLESYRRVDWTVALAYGTDYDKARDAILNILNSDPRVVKDTIDADRELRQEKEMADAEKRRHEFEKKCGGNPECLDATGEMALEEKKEGWWRRLWSGGRRHREAVKRHLAEDPNLTPSIPGNENLPPFVGLGELADSSINFTVRAWTYSDNYWPLFFDMNQRFYTELPKLGFEFPFPQMDVHLSKA